MKSNRCKQILADGGTPVGHMVMEFHTRGMAQMLAVADLDFALIDTEHSAFSQANVADLVAWLQATDIAPIVRVPQLDYHFIARALDAGALGIMVPNVKSGDEARALVSAAKYAALGERGVGLGAALTRYQAVDPAEFMAYSNDNTLLLAQIESVQALDNLDDIASTTGIDVLWVGQFDLTQSMGIPGQFEHERFLDALQQVIDAARRHDKAVGAQPNSIDQARAWMDMGMSIISYSSDHAVYKSALSTAVGQLRSAEV